MSFPPLTVAQQTFMDRYLATLSPAARDAIPQCHVEHFCADEANANECARLIRAGIKTASCSLLAGYEVEQQPLPAVGQLTLVLDWAQQPVCIIKLTEVSLCSFDQVPASFAAEEGEGDRSYAWWRTAHLAFFEAEARALGIEFSGQSVLVLERFEKVYDEISRAI